MRSAARIKGHPIHPMLVPFPVAFLAGSVGFDIAGTLRSSPSLWTTGGYLALAGIVAALLAAVPGFIDYLKTVPPRSSARKRATRHMIVNLGAVALFTLAALLRGGASNQPAAWQIAIGLVALALLSAGGWMGGELVVKNQISVANRYASAGRWRELTLEGASGSVVPIPGANQLKPNQMMLLRVDGRRIVLARTEDGFAAFDDRCTHRGGSLAGGTLICGTVQCPWHGSQFEVRTGAVTGGPASAAVKSYELRTRNGGVALVIP